ncbi:MAG: DUF4159 domain-containing protein, partial [Gammaproteobacteria bacterium]|nr:DUF4159 domain-containing protein [Gammaproteobacteria bacterium]
MLGILTAGVAVGQFGSFRQYEPSPLPAAPQAEFHFARLAYNTNGRCAGSRGYCNPMWSIDYPHAEAHFLPALTRFTRIDAANDSAHIQILDEELFDYPWILIQQLAQGGFNPSQAEAERLREYLMRGGFLVVDDIHGEDEWVWLVDVISRVLPGMPIVDIEEEDLLLNIIFDVDNRTQIPGERHLGRGMEGPAHWRAIYDRDGRMLVAINHNIDMGDAWEHADDPWYPEPYTALAYRFAVNYLIYS